MTVLIVGVPEGPELEHLRTRIQRNPHFRVISHAHTPAVALAHARALLPDITVLTLPGTLQDNPTALDVLHGVRALDPPGAVVLRTPTGTTPHDPDNLTTPGAVHHIRTNDTESLIRALHTIGQRRATCDPDHTP
ncbi:hypothetical protein ACGFYY_20925 [Streptomyces sp. NPDC048331]|uniref:hypothetical protein n=1 Tax=Streptomyces sp. NPDC048331 TaxID=3365534 RepID=UPI0037238D91